MFDVKLSMLGYINWGSTPTHYGSHTPIGLVQEVNNDVDTLVRLSLNVDRGSWVNSDLPRTTARFDALIGDESKAVATMSLFDNPLIEDSNTIDVVNDAYAFVHFLNQCRRRIHFNAGVVESEWFGGINHVLLYKNKKDEQANCPTAVIIDVTKGVPLFSHVMNSMKNPSFIDRDMIPLSKENSESWDNLASLQNVARAQHTIVVWLDPSAITLTPLRLDIIPGKTVNDVFTMGNYKEYFLVQKYKTDLSEQKSTDERDVSIDIDTNTARFLAETEL